jgi:urea transport system permease protein
MSALPRETLTPTLSREREREYTVPPSSLSRWREKAGVRAGVALALIAVLVLAPALNLLVPQGSAFHLSDYAVALIGKIMCYAICALAMDLIWGYTGILSLGHGVFFALGGYAMGMYLMRQIGRDGQYRMDMPDFMVFLDW